MRGRESFIREFLETHLSQRIAVGTGEIIDANSKPNEPRPQIDIILYKRDYPRIHFGGGIHGFFVESVIATVEVKSLLTKEELSKAFSTGWKIKQLKQNIIVCATSGYNTPSILSFVVAYDGPASMKTIHGWLPDIYAEHRIAIPSMPLQHSGRMSVASPAIDGIYFLGKGYLQYDNCPQTIFQDDYRQQNPGMRWQAADTETGALLMLFMWLTLTACNSSEMWLNPMPYIAGLAMEPGRFWAGGP